MLAIPPMASGAPGQGGFPYGSELRMDARPVKGSKRIPLLEVESNGAATLDLWCDSVQSQFVVAGDTVTVIIGPKTQRACSQEQTQADSDLLAALEAVTTWRREGDGVVLVGARELRFRPSTN
jgi:hypothetical protein